MAFPLGSVIIIVEIAWLVALVVIAIYSFHLIYDYSLPIPTALGALVLALPIITGFSGETLVAATTREDASIRPQGRWTSIVFMILLVYETVIATLAGTYIAPPAGLLCGLDAKWEHLFASENTGAIKFIQDSLDCCGFQDVDDRAWPFPNPDTPFDSCAARYDRTASCALSWRRHEQIAGGLLLTVAVATFLWQVTLIIRTSRRISWFSQAVDGEDVEDEEDLARRRRALGFRDIVDRFLDNPNEEDEEGQHAHQEVEEQDLEEPEFGASAHSPRGH